MCLLKIGKQYLIGFLRFVFLPVAVQLIANAWKDLFYFTHSLPQTP